MEETGLIEKIIRRIFRIPEMALALSITTVLCLPWALGELVRDAGDSLFVPLTIIGMLIIWLINYWKIKNRWAGLVVYVLGPLLLLIRVGQMSAALFEVVKQSFAAVNIYVNALINKSTYDFSSLDFAWMDLSSRLLAFFGRLSLWIDGILHGIRVEDPLIRTFIWSLVLWFVAVWAGWQMFRRGNFLLGVLPVTIILAFLLNFTRENREILWLHLALTLFLLGLSRLAALRADWESSGRDYSDGMFSEWIGIAAAIAVQVVALAYFASVVSIKDISENIREWRNEDAATQGEALGLQPSSEGNAPKSKRHGPTLLYQITGGPDLTQDLVMTISTGDLPPMPANASPIVPRYYWRMQTYQIYLGNGWMNPPMVTKNFAANQAMLAPPDSGYRVVHQQVTFPIDDNRLYWTGALMQANVPFAATVIDAERGGASIDSNLVAASSLNKSFEAESILLNVDAKTLRAAPAVYPDWVRSDYLSLPDSVPERVLALARDITAAEATPYDRAIAIQNYLRQFPYTLDVPAPPRGRDAADYFLFDLQKGYCDYYATSMAVLARAAGLPSRMVIGYAGGSYDLEHAEYHVVAEDAHAWVEIYFAGIGWAQFEPTAAEPPILYGDSIESDPSAVQPVPAQTFNQQFKGFFTNINFSFPAMLLAAALMLWLSWDLIYLPRLDPSQRIRLVYRKMLRLSRPLRGSAEVNQTPHQHALSLNQKLLQLNLESALQKWVITAAKDIDQITEIYSADLFAREPLSANKTESVTLLWFHLRWKLLAWTMLVGISKMWNRF